MKFLNVFNIFLVAGLVIFAFVLYGREHATRLAERRIRRIEAEIAREEESMRLLRIEWAMLTNPERLERMAGKHLKLRVTAPERIMPAPAALAATPRRKPQPAAEEGAEGALSALIARIQKEEAAR